MFEKKSKTIGGVAFNVTPFPALEALRLKAYIVKKISPALGELIAGVKDNGKSVMDSELDGEQLSKGISMFCEQLSEEEFVSFIQRVFANVWTVVKEEGTSKSISVSLGEDFAGKMDLVFQGKLFQIYPVMLFVLEVNFPDFFEKVRKGFGGKFQTIFSKVAGEKDSK